MQKKPVEVNAECGRRLSLLLKKHQYTQKKFAEYFEYEPQHISNIVRGKRRLTADFAERIAREIFLDVRPEWLMCRDDFETEEEKAANSKRIFEDNQKTDTFYNKIFKCFVDSLKTVSGYGLHSQSIDDLIGEFIVVTDKNGKNIGAVTVESFGKLRDEVEHYTSYLIHLLVKNEMMAFPIAKNGGGCNG